MAKLSKALSQQAGRHLFDNLIAVAGGGFQALAVEDVNFAVAVVNESRILKDDGGFRNTSASHPKHMRDELLGEEKVI